MTPEAGASRRQSSGDSPSACRSSSSSSEIRSAAGFRPLLLKPERAGAQAADRPGRDLEDEDAPIVDAALGVNRAMREADRGRRAGDGVDDVPLHRLGRRGRRHVDRLFEERTVERVGLVEQGQRVERPVMEQPFERELPALDEPFHQHRVVRLVALGADLRRGQQRPHPHERLDKRRGIVGADDAAASRQRQRLDDARVGDGAGDLVGIGVGRGREKPRHEQVAVAQTLARQQLVARDGRGHRLMAREAQRLAHHRRDRRRTIADDEDAVDGIRAGALENGLDGTILVVEPHRDGGVLPGILEHVAPIGREDELDAEPLGGFAEHARLVSGGGGEQKDATHHTRLR